MNYCPNCGAPLAFGQSFCRNCGLDVRETPTAQVQPQPPTVWGLGRNTVAYLTPEGMLCARIRSPVVLFLAMLAPLAVISVVYYAVQAGALAIYITAWAAVSALLYDELRLHGVRRLGAEPPAPGGSRRSWLVPWRSITMADWNGKTLWFASTDPSTKASITFNRDDAPVVERTLDSWNVRYSWRGPRLPASLTRFSTLALLLFLTGQAILILAAVLPFFPGEKQTYVTIANNTRNQVAGATFLGEFQAIFINNIQVALGGAIPFLGALTYGIASYNTGRALQAIAITAQPSPVPSYALVISLYLLPHTWVEESAYPIATVAGILAFTKWRSVSPGEFVRRRGWGSTKLVMALGGAAMILVAAAVIETVTAYVGFAILALWVPLAIAPYLVRRRRRRPTEPAVGTP